MTKKLPILHKSKKLSILLVYAVVILINTFFPFLTVRAATNVYKQLNSPLYDPNDACAPSDSATTPTDTTTPAPAGSAAEALQKQTDLDPKWTNLILKNAAKYGTDPIAMASILFWENRGFPTYKTSGWAGTPDSGLGPWQFTSDTWNNYSNGDVNDPVDSTAIAAQYIKSAGGKAGSPGGSIEQDFSNGKNLASMATVMKVYNAGAATYRAPGVAKYMAAGRVWNQGSQGAWYGDKQKIIDDYIVAGTYLYFQIATGQKVTYRDTTSYVQEALTKQDQIKSFAFGGSIGATVDSSGDSSCVTSCSAGSTTGDGKTIVIDPGHTITATPKDEKDPVTGLYVEDYNNDQTTELQQVYDASVRISKKLKDAGFNVVNTKQSVNDVFSLSERAQKINNAKPILAVTLHGDSGATWLAYPDSQSRRVPHDSSRKDGTDSLVHPDISGPSKAFAEKMAPVIAQKTGTSSYKALSFYDYYHSDGLVGNGLNVGNTPVQTILQSVPSVYSEFPLSKLNNSFADAMADAIIQAAKPAVASKKVDNSVLSAIKKVFSASKAYAAEAATGSCSSTGGAVAGSIAQTALNFSWPESHGLTPKPEYKDAIQQYNPGMRTDGADCGIFVATVMRASRADKNYPPSGTAAQEAYVRSSGKYDVVNKVSSTSELQPGDILIVNLGSGANGNGHTYIFVGPQPPKGYNEASASQDTRSANLGTAVLSDSRGNYLRARLK